MYKLFPLKIHFFGENESRVIGHFSISVIYDFQNKSAVSRDI